MTDGVLRPASIITASDKQVGSRSYLFTDKEQSIKELQTIGMSRYNKKYKYTENMLRKE